MTDDIPAQLRALKIMDEVRSDNPLGRNAADLIERLTAERDAALDCLEASQDSNIANLKFAQDQSDKLCAANAAVDLLDKNAGIQAKLLADTGRKLEAARMALEEIAALNGKPIEDFLDCVPIAKVALELIAQKGKQQ